MVGGPEADGARETVGPPGWSGETRPSPGWQDPAPKTGAPRTLGPYVLERELGRGGMGVIYLGYDPRMRRQVAIKKIQGDVEPNHLERFQREAQLAGRLRHPGIAQVHEVVLVGPGAPYLVQEFVAGTPLIEVCKRERLSGRRAAGIVRQTCAALEVAHASGILHRDLKPQNVMLTEGDHPVLLDFGLAKDLGDQAGSLTEAGQMLGTVAYAAPEQIEAARDVDARADVYGLGAVLYQCLSGVAPFSGASQVNVLTAVLTKPVSREPLQHAHRDLVTICLKCLEKEPGDRYPSAAELGADLARFLEGEPIEARPLSLLARTRRRLWRSKSLLLLAGLLLLAVGGGALYGARGITREAQARDKVEQAAELLQRLEEAQRYRYQPLRADPAEERALIAGARGEVAGLLTQLEALTGEEPRPAQVFLYQGWAHLALLDLGRAESAASAALERDPSVARAHVLRGRVATLRFAIGSLGEEDSANHRDRRAQEAATEFRSAVELGQTLGAGEAAWFALARGDHAEVLRQVALVPAHRSGEERSILRALATMPFRRALRPGELRDARGHLDEALRLCPRSLEALVLRALLHMRVGLGRQALPDLTRALLLKPQDAQLRRFRAEVYYLLERDPEGLADADQAIAAEPGYAYAHAIRGLLLQRLGQPAEARAALDEAVRRAPTSSRILVHRVSLRRLQGDFDGALSDLALARELEGDGSDLHITEAEVRASRGDLSGAYRCMSRAIESAPELGMLFAQRGAYALDLRRYRAAAEDYQRALELEYVRGTVFMKLALALRARKDFEGALRAITRGLAIEPQSPELLCLRAQVRAEAGDVAGSRADLDAAIRIAPSAEAHFARASLRTRSGDAQGALADLNAALGLDPKHTRARAERGLHLARAGKLEPARADLDAVILQDPKHVEARVNRGMLLAQQGKASAARADYDAAIKADGTCASAYTQRAILRMQQKDTQGALSDLEQAVRFGARSRLVYFMRGQAYRALGRHREAALDWERGLGIEDGTANASPIMRPYIQQHLGRPSRH